MQLVRETFDTRYQVASPTIDQCLRDFLARPLYLPGRLKCDDRESTIDMFKSYAFYHGHSSLSQEGRRLLQEQQSQSHSQKTAVPQGYQHIFGPDKIPALLPEFFIFLSYEMTPVASQKFLRSVCLNLEELCLWLIREDLIDQDEGEEAGSLCRLAADNLPRAMRALRQIHKLAQAESQEEIRWTAEGESEIYTITRLASRFVWLESREGEKAGPIEVGEKARANLELGWEIHCSLIKLHSQWQIIGLGGIYPFPRQR